MEASIRLRSGMPQDVATVMALVRTVVPLMRASGNTQWDDDYPNAGVFDRDVDLGQLWLAEIGGALAGVAAFTRDQEPEYAEVGWDLAEAAVVVHRLAVSSEFRGRGIATALMLHAETVARAQGIGVVRVDTDSENEATRRLFPRLGYGYAGEIGLRFRPGLRFRCYEKRLAGV